MTHALFRLASAVACRLRRVAATLTAGWRDAVGQRGSERLDAATLRDLGLSASEFGSYRAESDGKAQRTRRRV